MAKIYGQLEKAQLENTTSDTASHPKGMITYRTDLNQAKVSNGTAYKLLIDEDSTQTLSNKTYANPSITGAITSAQTTTPANPASGSNKLYFKADGKLYTLDSAGNEAMVGSGTGGVKNLITNGNADDTASSIFTTYADAAGTRPVDGTGGSPTVTTSISTSSPLDGTKSFLLTKPASNTQGQGWSVASFTVDPAYRAKALKISLDYIVNSGTFVAGSSTAESDVIWYIYDITNSQLIEPSNIKMFSNSSTISDKFEATFQTSATGASYRLIAHCQSTSALAYELKVDNITVGPQTYVYGTPVAELPDYTPTLSGLGTGSATINYCKVTKMANRCRIDFRFTKDASTGSGATAISFTLPSGILISSTITANFFGGSAGSGNTTNGNYEVYYDTSANNIKFLQNDGTNFVGSEWLASSSVGGFIEFPVQGWASSVQISDSYDGREIALKLSTNSGSIATVATTWTTITFTTPDFDDVSGWNGSDTYTFKSAGKYEIGVMAGQNSASANYFKSGYRINGGSDVPLTQSIGKAGGSALPFGGTKIKVNAGDTLQFRGFTEGTEGIGSTRTAFINKLSSSQAIASVEYINARYSTSAGQSIPNNTATIVEFGSKSFDSHNAVTTGPWKFTAMVSGKFRVSSMILFTSGGGWAAGEFVELMLYKNGSKYSDLNNYFCEAAHSTFVPVAGTDVIELVAGDYIDVRCRQNSGASLALNANGQNNHVEITLER